MSIYVHDPENIKGDHHSTILDRCVPEYDSILTWVKFMCRVAYPDQRRAGPTPVASVEVGERPCGKFY